MLSNTSPLSREQRSHSSARYTTDKKMEEPYEDVAHGLFRQHDGNGRKLRNDEEQDDVAVPEEEHLHFCYGFRVARGEVGQ